MSAVSACRMRGVGPTTLIAAIGRPAWSRIGVATQATPSSCSSLSVRSRGGGCATRSSCSASSVVSVLGVDGASGAPPSSASTSAGSRQASSALPAPDVCAGIARPISVNRRTLRVPDTTVDVDDVAALEHDEVRRLAGLALDRLQVRARGGAQPLQAILQPARQLEQLVAEQVAPAGRALRGVAARDERAQQPVRRARHQAGLRGDLRHAELVRGRERLEQVERPFERLDALRGTSRAA